MSPTLLDLLTVRCHTYYKVIYCLLFFVQAYIYKLPNLYWFTKTYNLTWSLLRSSNSKSCKFIPKRKIFKWSNWSLAAAVKTLKMFPLNKMFHFGTKTIATSSLRYSMTYFIINKICIIDTKNHLVFLKENSLLPAILVVPSLVHLDVHLFT